MIEVECREACGEVDDDYFAKTLMPCGCLGALQLQTMKHSGLDLDILLPLDLAYKLSSQSL
jgi:hypothetical protein